MKPFRGDKYFNTDHLRSKLRERSIKGAGSIVFARVISYGVGMIGTVILARLLTPDDFGLIAMVVVFSLLLQNFGVNGFIEAVIQKDEINHKQLSTLFWINMGINLVLMLLFMAIAPLIAWLYDEPRLKVITIAIAFSIIIAGLSAQHLALLNRSMQFYKISANEIVAVIISVTVAITLAWYGWGYWALVARRVVLPLATTTGAWTLCWWWPGVPSRCAGVKSMLKFAINTYGSFVMTYFSRNLDKILIGRHYGSISLGNYQKAYDLFVMPANQLTVPLSNVSLATLSRLRNEPEKYRRYYLNAVSMIAFVGMVFSAILVLIGKDFILLLLGAQWEEAGGVFSAFAPSIGIMMIYNTHRWIHLSLGRADQLLRWSIISLIVIVVLIIVGIPYGPLGIAIAYTTSFYVLIVPGIWYAGRPIHLKFSSLFSVIWKYFLSALTAGLLCWFVFYSFDLTSNIFVELNVFVRILVSCILCILIYLLLIVALYQSTKPILNFISVLYDMIPGLRSKKTEA